MKAQVKLSAAYRIETLKRHPRALTSGSRSANFFVALTNLRFAKIAKIALLDEEEPPSEETQRFE